MSDEELLARDAAGRLRALTPGSFIVEAPAGAGKTELLTQRVLMLLARVAEPEEIVAITFTNKAAAEMRQRVVEALQRAARGDVPAAAHKRATFDLAQAALAVSAQRGWHLLEHPGRLRVTTIDAYCAALARQMPVLSRFGSQPRTVDDARRHYEEAARRALAWLEDEGEHAEAVARALARVDNDAVRLTGLLADMLARRDQWLRYALEALPVHEAEHALGDLVTRSIRSAQAVLPPRRQGLLMPVARYAAGNVAAAHSIARLRDWQHELGATPEDLPLWQALTDLLLTQAGSLRSRFDKTMGLPAGKEAEPFKAVLKEIIAGLGERDAVALARLRRLPAPAYTEDEWATVVALATLLRLAAAELWMVFHQAGEVDFIEVAGRAQQALGDPQAPTDLALALDYGIRHLLVDEFQDTSPGQVELLRRLTAGWQPGDGRSLFLVGDPMQSIYRFRKADVGLFLAAARDGIGSLSLERLCLFRNNRSCAPVVDWVNATFAGVFPADDEAAAGAIAYRRFAATRAPLPAAGVTVHGLVVEREADGDALEAERLLAIIDAERSADPTRQIAVLVRARAHLDTLVAQIRRRRPDLSFSAVEIEALGERQPVQDLLALTHALHHRADRVNWLAVLRAPWCGLTLADLHLLVGDDHAATVWSLLNDDQRLARLSDDGRQRALHVRRVLADVLGEQGRQAPARWLMGAWLQLGGAATLADATQLADCEAYFTLVETLAAAGRFTPEEVAREMTGLYGAVDAAADGRLQFMTLHKSKGLEFDTVILPGLHRPSRAPDKRLVLWEEVLLDDGREHLIAAPLKKRGQQPVITPYDYLAELEKIRADNEAARLLYVGATRAVRHLHLVGVARRNAKGEVKAPANTFLDRLWPAVGSQFVAAGPQPAEGRATPEFLPQLLRVAQPVVIDLPHRPPPAAAVAADGPGEVAGIDAGESFDAWVGTLTHLYLELIAREGPDAWPVARLQGVRAAMAIWLGRQGCKPSDAQLGADRVVAMLETTLASEEGRWILRSRPGAVAEFARVHAEAGGSSRHVVDRSFVEEGVRWIIDYKTTAVTDDLLAHAERHRAQLERYASLFVGEGLPLRLGVFYTAPGRLVTLN